jgi:hypothetical protein
MKTQIIANITWDDEKKVGGKVLVYVLYEQVTGERGILHFPAHLWGDCIQISKVDRKIWVWNNHSPVGIVSYDRLGKEETKTEADKELEEILSGNRKN